MWVLSFELLCVCFLVSTKLFRLVKVDIVPSFTSADVRFRGHPWLRVNSLGAIPSHMPMSLLKLGTVFLVTKVGEGSFCSHHSITLSTSTTGPHTLTTLPP